MWTSLSERFSFLINIQILIKCNSSSAPSSAEVQHRANLILRPVRFVTFRAMASMALAGSAVVVSTLNYKNPYGLSQGNYWNHCQTGYFRASNCRLSFADADMIGSSLSKLSSAIPTSRNGTLIGAGVCRSSLSESRPASQPRFIQHKQEAFWFYRFLSIIYDHVINPGHWTEDMRDDALEPADLYSRKLLVLDVGGGTGFSTLGIVKHVDAKNVTILDQSPHQLAKAKQKEPLKECKIVQGDAEDLPFPTDYADRYISAGSIEYWPDPQRGIKEAYRVLKLGGKACVIGPVYPTFWLSRFFADMWMLFPKEEEYIEWFTKAGFKDVKLKRIGPKWYRGVRRHGLIMGCSVTGVKRASGDSPLQLGPKAEDVKTPVNPLVFLVRFILGGIASTYFVVVPIYMWIKDKIVPKGQPI